MIKLSFLATLFAFGSYHVTSFSPSISLASSDCCNEPGHMYGAPCVPPTTTMNPSHSNSRTIVLQMSQENDEEKKETKPLPIRRAFLASSLLAGIQLFAAQAYAPSGFKRVPTQFIAALGDPNANSGSGAREWGLWQQDPGPRGVWLRQYKDVLGKDGKAPAGWKFDPNDWWLEEHGLIMEAPQFPIQPGRYLVTGGRSVTTGLTIDASGNWKLEDPNAKLYDVTHLPCRSARYHPNAGNGSPLTAKASDFPVSPGAEMPKVDGCDKQDYAVLFLIGKEA